MKNIFKTPLMKICSLGLALCLFSITAQAQEEKESFFKKHRYVNMTEFGGLFGRFKYQIYYGWYPSTNPPQYQVSNKVNFSLQTFNGIYLNRKTSAGITVGVDGYGKTLLMPVALGVRRNLVQKKEGGSILLGGLDAGYATTWLNEDDTGFKTTGGLMISPTIGYKLPMRNSSAWLINIGYRFQQAEYRQLQQGDLYWTESSETRKYRRLVFRMGIEF